MSGISPIGSEMLWEISLHDKKADPCLDHGRIMKVRIWGGSNNPGEDQTIPGKSNHLLSIVFRFH